MKSFVCCAGLFMLALLMAGCAGLAGEPAIVGTIPATATTVARPVSLPQTPPDLALGASVFAVNCTRCHGLEGRGDGELVQSGQVPPLMDFTDPQTARDATPVDWYQTVTNGRLEKLMPPWGDKLSEAERWSVTLYLYTLPNTDEQIAQGQVVWAAKCAECHGQQGQGTLKGAPLPDLLTISTSRALAVVADGLPDKMPPLAADLTLEQREAVIAYARTLRLGAQAVEVAQGPTPALTEAAAAPLSTQELAAPAPTQAASPATQAVVAPLSTQEVGAAVTGTVSGTVTNSTAGGVVPADLALSLHILSADGQSEVQTLTGTVGAGGSYRFADVPFTRDAQYVVTAAHGGAVYNSEVVVGDPASPQLDLPLSIYDVADDPASISVNGILMMLQPDTQPGLLSVVEIVSFTNTSDRAFLRQDGTTPASVSVRLPPGAVYQDFSGGSYQLSADGSEISDTQPVLPGDEHVMHLVFTIPTSGTVSLAQSLSYPLNGQLEIMVPSDTLSVSGSEISTLGTRQMGDRSFTSFGGTYNRPAGGQVEFQVSGAANSASASASTAVVPVGGISVAAYALIGVGLLAIGAAFGFFLRERTGSARNGNARANKLIRQIADLDMRYEQRKISVNHYNVKRQALKDELTALLKAQAQPGSTDK